MSEMAILLQQRDMLLHELRALENKVAGLNMAIAILEEAEPLGETEDEETA